jgi:ribonuclease P protein component
LFVLKNGLPDNRIAVTFARKFGNAVKRNRTRRVSREAYRLLRNRLKAGFDLVLLVYPARTADSVPMPAPVKDCLAVRMTQMQNLFSRAGLLRKTGNDDDADL